MMLDYIMVITGGNVKRHYETNHKSFEQTYPLKTEVRAQTINISAQFSHQTRESGGVRNDKERKTVQLLGCVEIVY